jgi:hypothetical protein
VARGAWEASLLHVHEDALLPGQEEDDGVGARARHELEHGCSLFVINSQQDAGYTTDRLARYTTLGAIRGPASNPLVEET